ncbi:MAG: Hint domain-containing protein [Planktomarina sp.]
MALFDLNKHLNPFGSILRATNGADTINGTANDEYINALEGNDVVYAGSGADTVDGQGGDDFVDGGHGDDILGSGSEPGNDTMYGGSGNDIITGDTGNDRLEGQHGNDSVYGGAGNDVIGAGSEAGNDDVRGGSGDDTVSGRSGDDTISGNDGNDRVTGDQGDDTLYAGQGNDIVESGSGDDIGYGHSGDDTVYGRQGDDILYAGAGNDSMNGMSGEDLLYGGAGDDKMDGERGSDTLYGGSGDDKLQFNNGNLNDIYPDGMIPGGTTIAMDEFKTLTSPDNMTAVNFSTNGYFYAIQDRDADGAADTLFTFKDGNGDQQLMGMTSAVDHITFGTDGSITVYDENNAVLGQMPAPSTGTQPFYFAVKDTGEVGMFDANDMLVTTPTVQSSSAWPNPDGLANDTPPTWTGVDQANAGVIGDFDGDGIKDVDSGEDLLYGGAGDDSIRTDGANDTVYGESGDDVLEGTVGTQELYGGIGDDSIDGGSGDDSIDGGSGDDSVYGGAGNDTIVVSSGSDLIDGGSGDNTIDVSELTINGVAVTADDIVFDPETGVSTLTHDGGTLTFENVGVVETSGGTEALPEAGTAGADALTGTANADTLAGLGGNDTISGLGNNDIIYGGARNDSIMGNSGADSLYGASGDDTVYGNAGDDVVIATPGADLVYGGSGDDDITVGSGDDVAYGGSGSDTIDSGFGNDTVFGGENTGDNDVLDVSGLTWLGNPVTADQVVYGGGDNNSGTLTHDQGTVTFNGIESIQYASGTQPVCFTRGTMIDTDQGEVAIEDLEPGMMVRTLGNGMQPIRWIGRTTAQAMGAFAPIRIKAGTLGNTRDLRVSPRHRMHLSGWQLEMLFDHDHALVTAEELVNDTTVLREPIPEVEYFHVMFDAHEVIFAEGSASESFHPDQPSMGSMDAAARAEVLALFPELKGGTTRAEAAPTLAPEQAAYLAQNLDMLKG